MKAATPAERARAYRDRLRGRPVTLAPCGTRAAATRHRRTGEEVCDGCKVAERKYQQQAKARSRNRTGSGTNLTSKETT